MLDNFFTDEEEMKSDKDVILLTNVNNKLDPAMANNNIRDKGQNFLTYIRLKCAVSESKRK